MARLRFPGRPGHRFDRISVRFFADDVKNLQDPSLAFLPQFQRGLKSFRDIVGLSDEEEDFEGFSKAELAASQKKYDEYTVRAKKRQTEEGVIFGQQSVKLGSKIKFKGKGQYGKIYKCLPKEDIDGSSSKTFDQPGFCEGTSIKNVAKPKTFKLDYKHGIQHVKPTVKTKKTEKDMAKFLLEKAKQANKLVEQKRIKRLSPNKKTVQRKAFVLPTKSSRSSRVIKPNKRLLDDESVDYSIVQKKSKPAADSPKSPPVIPKGKFSLGSAKISRPLLASPKEHVLFTEGPGIGLLDQPLIVDGKRDRKPSLKLQLSDEESFGFPPNISPLRSPLAAPKLGTGLFQQSQFQKGEKQKLLNLGSSRKQGSSIVQKAKLQLNRAALNKSKAALARSLKAEIKRQAKKEISQKQADTPVVKDVEQSESKRLLKTKLLQKFGRHCVICSITKSKDELRMYMNKVIMCNNCLRSYKASYEAAEKGTFVKSCCPAKGKCIGHGMCRDCRLTKCIAMGLPAVGLMLVHYGKSKILNKSADSLTLSSPEASVRSRQTFISPSTSIIDDSPVQPAARIDKSATELELSPLKVGEGSDKKQRKRRAFKELLRTKQERSADSDSTSQDLSQCSEPVTPLAVGSVEISPKGSGSGPRIKHVCRNAAVALGRPLATFPEKSELRLSALPTKDKVQLWKKDEECKSTDLSSDDERPMADIIQQSSDSGVTIIRKTSPAKPLKKLTGAGGLHLYKRKIRCKKCRGCLALDCGKCRFCKDKPKFGGAGIIKQCCVNRKCEAPLVKRSATEAFINPKPKMGLREKLPQPGAKIVQMRPNQLLPDSEPSKSDLDLDSAEGSDDLDDDLDPVIPGSERSEAVHGLGFQAGTLLDQAPAPMTSDNNNSSDFKAPQKQTQLSKAVVLRNPQSQSLGVTRVGIREIGQSSEVRRLTFEDESADFRLERLPSRRPGKLPTKLAKKLELNQKYTKREGGNDGQCYPVSLQSINPASRQWGSLLSQPSYYPIKVDFKRSCDMNSAWRYGIALTMSSAMSVRTLCFLCGSAGKHELIYCNICCEPFHEFCLEDWEQPEPGHYDDWICPACQFCHVCGRQNNLLQCDKCQNTYHPGCLGPNYPTKPSKRKNIWICTKCVKCKSCGATTPGSAAGATWTYDFSLCNECGKLMDKGNFCPICKKCYSDDDWESKMIQCNMCESWVHSKCEGLTDEMYEILSYLPEDLSFYCRKCFPVGCPEWESTLKRELSRGLENILQTLILAKSAQFLLKHEKKKSPPKEILAEVEPQDSSVNLVRRNLTDIGSDIIVEKCNKDIESKDDSGNGKHKSKDDIETDKFDSKDNCENGKLLTEGGGSFVDVEKADVVNQCDKNETVDKVESEIDKVCHGAHDCEKESNVRTNDERNLDIAASESVAQTTENTKTKVNKNSESGENCVQVCDKSAGEIAEGKSEDKRTDQEEIICDVEEKMDTEDVGGECLSDKIGSYANDESESQGVNDKSADLNVDVNETECMQVDCDKDELKVETEASDNPGEKIGADCDMKEDLNEDKENSTGTVQSTESNVDKAVIDGVTELSDTKTVECKQGDAKEAGDTTATVDGTVDGNVVSAKPRVQFNVGEYLEKKKDIVKEEEEDMDPKDLMEVVQKMKAGDYKSVGVFCEDILRVIQTYLDEEDENRAYKRKATQTARSVFVKQIERIFPWFNVKTCRHWYSSKSLPKGMLPDATLPPNDDHTYAQWLERIEPPRSPQHSPYKKKAATPVKRYIPDDEDLELGQLFEGEDERPCIFCQTFGDQDGNEAGRLLYCGQDDWCHVNCALWSAEVYEDADGALLNLPEAFSRGKQLRCDVCNKNGATVGCNTRGCKSNYHFMCARRWECRLQEDKKVFCKAHRFNIDGELLPSDKFNVIRRVYVNVASIRTTKKKWSKGLHVADINVLFGSCCVESLGRLTDLSDKPKYLQPVDFLSTRLYWSTKDARRRCMYTCRIIEVRPDMLKFPAISLPDMRIVHDPKHPEFVPLEKLDLSSYGINLHTGHKSLQRASVIEIDDFEDPVVDLTGVTDKERNYSGSSRTLSADETGDMTYGPSMDYNSSRLTANDSQLSLGTGTFGGSLIQRRASMSSVQPTGGPTAESQKLNASWPRSNTSKATMPSNKLDSPHLSFLSPKTLKLLNLDPSKYVRPRTNSESNLAKPPVKVDVPVNNNMGLLQIANRLNDAAAKCSKKSGEDRSSRSPSVERCSSQMASGPFSPIEPVRSERSKSVERGSIVQTNVGSYPNSSGGGFSMLKWKNLPSRPFSPPVRMVARSRSLSVEKEKLLLKTSADNNIELVKNIDGDQQSKTVESTEPFLPPNLNSNSPLAVRRGRSVSDPISSTPKPVGFSSPVVEKSQRDEEVKKVLISDTSEAEESMDLTDDINTGNECGTAVATESDVGVLDTDTADATVSTVNKDNDSLNSIETATESLSRPVTENSLSEAYDGESEGFGPNVTESDLSENITSQNDTVEGEMTEEENENSVTDTTADCSETIVVMTDSGEMLSEEEAIRIVQEVMASGTDVAEDNGGGVLSNVENNEYDVDNNDDLINTKNDNNEEQNISDDKNQNCEQSEGTESGFIQNPNIQNITNDSCELTRKTSSPFIPQIVESGSTPDLESNFSHGARGISIKKRFLSANEKTELTENLTEIEAKLGIGSNNDENLQKEKDEINVEVDEKLKGDEDESNEHDSEKVVFEIGEDDEEQVEEIDDNKDKQISCQLEEDIKDDNNMEVIAIDVDRSNNDSPEMEVLAVDPESDSESDVMDITESVLKATGNGNEIVELDCEEEKEIIKLDQDGIEGKLDISNKVDESIEKITNDNLNKDEVDGDRTTNGIELINERSRSPAIERDVILKSEMDCIPRSGLTSVITYSLKEKLDKEGKDIGSRGIGRSPVTMIPYPVRKGLTSPLRYRIGGEENSEGDCIMESSVMISLEEEQRAMMELPVLDPISKRIKEESIAKSCPGEKGPFKCEKCKREYRTEISYQVHTDNCNFCISSSDDDNEDSMDDKNETRERRITRSSKRTDSIEMESSEGDKEQLVAHETGECARTTLRKNTLNQRLAKEADKARGKNDDVRSPTRSGRQSLNRVCEDDNHKNDTVDGDVKNSEDKGGRSSQRGRRNSKPDIGNSGKSSGLIEKGTNSRMNSPESNSRMTSPSLSETGSDAGKRGRGRPRKSNVSEDNVKDKTDEADEETGSDGKKKGRGRPKKITANEETSVQKTNSDSDDDESKVTSRSTRSKSRKSDIGDSGEDVELRGGKRIQRKLARSNSQDSQPDFDAELRMKLERERLLLAEMVNRKRHLSSQSVTESTFLDEDTPQVKKRHVQELNAENNADHGLISTPKPAEKARKKRRRGRPKKDTSQQDKQANMEVINLDSSSDEEDEYLDPVSGLIVDKKTGQARSPTVHREENTDVTEPVENIDVDNKDMVDGCKDSAMVEGSSEPQETREKSVEKKLETEDAANGKKPEFEQEKSNTSKVRINSDDNVDTNKSNHSESKQVADFDTCIRKADTENEKKVEANTVKGSMETREEVETCKSSNDICDNKMETNDSRDSEKQLCAKISIDKNDDLTTIKDVKNQSTEKADKPVAKDNKNPSTYKDSKVTTKDNKNQSFQDFKEDEKKKMPGLPQAVLKLLKEGHKVVIKNPKTGKNFMWQKTETGYIGKPFDKELPEIKKKNASDDNSGTNTGTLVETKKAVSVGKSYKTKMVSEETQRTKLKLQAAINEKTLTASKLLFGKKNEPQNVKATTLGGQMNETQIQKPEFVAKKIQDALFSRNSMNVETSRLDKNVFIRTALTSDQMVKPDQKMIIQRRTKLVANNIEHFVEKLSQTSYSTAQSTGQTSARSSEILYATPISNSGEQQFSAEYVGGLLISTPKSKYNIETIKHRIESTAPLASHALQNTIQQISSANVLPNILQGCNQSVVSIAPSNMNSTSMFSSSLTGSLNFTPTGFGNLQSGFSNIQTGLPNFQTTLPAIETGYINIQAPMPAFQTGLNFQGVQSGFTGLQTQTGLFQGNMQSEMIQGNVQPSLVQGNIQTGFIQGNLPTLVQSQTGYQGMQQTGFNASGVSSVQIVNQSNVPIHVNTTPQGTFQSISQVPLAVNMGMMNVPMASYPASSGSSYQTGLVSQISPNYCSIQPNLSLNDVHSYTVKGPAYSCALTSSSLASNSCSQQIVNSESSRNYNVPAPLTILQKISQKISPKSSLQTTQTSQNSVPVFNQNQNQSICTASSSSQKSPQLVKLTHGGGSVKFHDKFNSFLKKRTSLVSRKSYTLKDRKSKVPFVEVEKMGIDQRTNVISVKLSNETTQQPKRKTVWGSNKDLLKLKKKLLGDMKFTKKGPKKRGRKKKLDAENVEPKGMKGSANKSMPLHSQRETSSLPAAALEEEVHDVPMSVLEERGANGGGDVEGHNLGHLEFEITSDDGYSWRADTLNGAWKQVTEKVQDARTASRQKHLSYAGLSGVHMFGLGHPQVINLVEQLYGASYCRRYHFKYHKHELAEREIELLNPTGSIRTEPFTGRNPTDMFSFLMSRYRQLPMPTSADLDVEMALKSSRRATSMDLPMAMRFRKLKEFSKECVGVYRSTIHGRGLFCKRNIDDGEMIIEYSGEIIRNALTDLREKYYESKGIGCYMFRIDDHDVVDATMRGSAARFINHSCDPNCYSKVINVDNRKHIVIFAMRKIFRGEELTYDYKFPIEEVKIPCTCGSKRCRKYLN
ncbi:uncharacterized protein LOC128233934 [Mya arenaria]|uniref:uncharacterized protein LOC128233934 n=1 Tax=Mya arenaria TaxID=6604 RepID=UPI0022E336F2|nr:uncharacterized protein LOC128233934 [Mya arenaria]